MTLFEAYTLMVFYCLGWFLNISVYDYDLRLPDVLVRVFFAAIWPITLVISLILRYKKRGLRNKKGGSK